MSAYGCLCVHCDGTGYSDWQQFHKCDECDGTGLEVWRDDDEEETDDVDCQRVEPKQIEGGERE